jgi:hypothetical protein
MGPLLLHFHQLFKKTDISPDFLDAIVQHEQLIFVHVPAVTSHASRDCLSSPPYLLTNGRMIDVFFNIFLQARSKK